MKYCSECGATVDWLVPPLDDRERAVCSECGAIHYQNPRVLVAAFLYHGGKLLWIKRGIPPNKGDWAFPAGFVEKGETLQQAAARELLEETGIEKSPDDMIPMGLVSLLAIDQLYISFRCRCDALEIAEVTAEAEASGWFNEQEAPWPHMAYPETVEQVRQTYRWVREGRFGVRVGQITDAGAQYITYRMDE